MREYNTTDEFKKLTKRLNKRELVDITFYIANQAITFAKDKTIDLDIDKFEDKISKRPSRRAKKVIEEVNSYFDNMNYGHAISKGSVEDKKKAYQYFNSASTIAKKLLSLDDVIESRFILPLYADALSCKASIEFYRENYDTAVDLYDNALNKINDFNLQFQTRQKNSRNFMIKAHKLANDTAKMFADGFDIDYLYNSISNNYDKKIPLETERIQQFLDFDDFMANSIGEWVSNKLDRNEIEVINHDIDRFQTKLLREEKATYIISLGKYYSNRAWASLVFCLATNGDEKEYQRSKELYNLAKNLLVDGFLQTNYSFNTIPYDLDKKYYEHDPKDVYHTEVQNSLSRIAIVQMIGAIEMSDDDYVKRMSNEYKRLSFFDKYFDSFISLENVNTAINNVKRVIPDCDGKKLKKYLANEGCYI